MNAKKKADPGLIAALLVLAVGVILMVGSLVLDTLVARTESAPVNCPPPALVAPSYTIFHKPLDC